MITFHATEFLEHVLDSRKTLLPRSIMTSNANFNAIMQALRPDRGPTLESVALIHCKFVVDGHIAENQAVVTWQDGKISFVDLKPFLRE